MQQRMHMHFASFPLSSQNEKTSSNFNFVTSNHNMHIGYDFTALSRMSSLRRPRRTFPLALNQQISTDVNDEAIEVRILKALGTNCFLKSIVSGLQTRVCCIPFRGFGLNIQSKPETRTWLGSLVVEVTKDAFSTIPLPFLLLSSCLVDIIHVPLLILRL